MDIQTAVLPLQNKGRDFMKSKSVNATLLIIVVLFSAVLSGGTVCGVFLPFSIAFCSALSGIYVPASAIGSIIGFAVFGKFSDSLNIVCALLVLCLITLIKETFKWRISITLRAVITALTVFVCDLVATARVRFTFTDFLITFTFASLCGFLSLSFSYVLKMKNKKDWIRPKKSQVVFVSVVFVSLICVLSSFELWICNLGRIVGIVCILLFARRSTFLTLLSSTLCLVAITLSNLPFGLSSVFLVISAVVASLFYEYGKFASALSFFALNVLGVFVVGVDIYSAGLVLDSLFGVCICLFIKRTPNIFSFLDNSDYVYKKLSLATDTICDIENSFISVANTLECINGGDSQQKLDTQRNVLLNQLNLAKQMFITASCDDLFSFGDADFDVQMKVISVPANNKVSGDTSKSFYDNGGNFFFCLCDGMGTGGRAAVDSAFLSKIICDLIKTGVDINTVMKTASDCMILKSSDESFSTADVIKINLKNKKAEITKVGSAPTYFISNGKVTKFATSSFPVGILPATKYETTKVDVCVGDIFVFTSDGAGDIEDLLFRLQSTNASIIAEDIVDFATKNPENSRDDISVAVIKLIKCR